jgi:hypothetical protein
VESLNAHRSIPFELECRTDFGVDFEFFRRGTSKQKPGRSARASSALWIVEGEAVSHASESGDQQGRLRPGLCCPLALWSGYRPRSPRFDDDSWLRLGAEIEVTRPGREKQTPNWLRIRYWRGRFIVQRAEVGDQFPAFLIGQRGVIGRHLGACDAVGDRPVEIAVALILRAWVE